MTDAAIKVEGLTRRYGGVLALDGVDLQVSPGEVVAVLGPNGAGKTTLVEILEGFRGRDAGQVEVLGVDPGTPGRRNRDRIGIVLQESGFEGELTVAEALAHQGLSYAAPRSVAEVLDLVGLAPKAEARIKTLSGGQRRRLDLALALAGAPSLLFLDEPTAGFDPEARRRSWDVIAGLARAGTTILLTTHDLEEAHELAARVVVISRGRVVAEGPPSSLGERASGPTTISFRVSPEGAEAMGIDGDGEEVSITTNDPVGALHRLTARALELGIELIELEVRRPSLEDVYLDLVGGGDAV